MHIRASLFPGGALKSGSAGWMSIFIAVVAMTLLILGCFMVLNYNVANLAEDIANSTDRCYIDNAGEQARRTAEETACSSRAGRNPLCF